MKDSKERKQQDLHRPKRHRGASEGRWFDQEASVTHCKSHRHRKVEDHEERTASMGKYETEIGNEKRRL
jgi:hypothetical protein